MRPPATPSHAAPLPGSLISRHNYIRCKDFASGRVDGVGSSGATLPLHIPIPYLPHRYHLSVFNDYSNKSTSVLFKELFYALLVS